MLGVFDNPEELDRPDLNKCPDCGCFFSGDFCPICGKLCPEEMRAGNRKPVKKQRRSRASSSGRVTFVDWYHSWWFIAIMMFIFPIAGIVLLITSPHQKWKKILFVAIAAVYMVVSTFGYIFYPYVADLFDKPVDTSLSRSEYVAACKTVSAEELHRSADGCKDDFVTITLTVKSRITLTDDYYGNHTYYLCTATDGSGLSLIVRDCLIEDNQNLLQGDIVTIYGECAGIKEVYDNALGFASLPTINMAYIITE